jgi:hypothetical protein
MVFKPYNKALIPDFLCHKWIEPYFKVYFADFKPRNCGLLGFDPTTSHYLTKIFTTAPGGQIDAN